MPPEENDGLDFGLDDTDETQTTERTEETTEEKLARLEKENAQFSAFKPFLEQLESDPTKIYDMRAAMSGQRKTEDARGASGSSAAAPAQENLTPDQIKELNTKVTDMILEGRGLEAVATVADQIATNRMSAFRSENDAILASQADSFVDAFRTRYEKTTDASLFKAIDVRFSEELEGLDRAALARQAPTARAKTLTQLWNAAAGEVLLKRVNKTPARPGSSFGGGVGGGAPQGKSAMTDKYRAMLKNSGMTDAEIKAFEAEELQEAN